MLLLMISKIFYGHTLYEIMIYLLRSGDYICIQFDKRVSLVNQYLTVFNFLEYFDNIVGQFKLQ